MVTALLIVEIAAQAAVARGCGRYLCGGGRACGRAFDLAIATISIALIVFEITRPATEGIANDADQVDQEKVSIRAPRACIVERRWCENYMRACYAHPFVAQRARNSCRK